MNRKLGEEPMSKITRRDFVNGTLMAAGASMLPFGATSQAVLAALEPSYYPPAMTGLRGHNVESYTHAHSKALARKSSWGTTTQLKEAYDLIVVGAGLWDRRPLGNHKKRQKGILGSTGYCVRSSQSFWQGPAHQCGSGRRVRYGQGDTERQGL